MIKNISLVFVSLLALCSCERRTELNAIVAKKDPVQKPIMGWSSWNHYYADISEEIIKSQADAMQELKLTDFGYQFINIDDGFYGGRDEKGNVLPHKERFPSGMKDLAEYIHSKGLKAGIYSDAGANTCASFWYKDTIGVGMGLFGFEKQDLKTYLIDWNYDFIKIDWCGGEWLGLDEQDRYTAIANTIQEIKPTTIYNVCRWEFPGKWVTNIADSWRISGDIDNNFNSILHIIDLNADLWIYAHPGHYNDMDMLQVGRGMTYEEDKTHFTMWCMMQSPLLLGNDLTQMSEETLKIITNEDIIALNQSSFVYQARRLVDYGETEIWAKPLVSTMSGKVAVALLNRTDEKQTISFDLETVGLKASEGYKGKDLWSKDTFETQYNKTISREVPPHGVVVLQLEGTAIPYNVFQYNDEQFKKKNSKDS